ncbi:unnamed protein product, partial [Meganyctiphanes norvegica]
SICVREHNRLLLLIWSSLEVQQGMVIGMGTYTTITTVLLSLLRMTIEKGTIVQGTALLTRKESRIDKGKMDGLFTNQDYRYQDFRKISDKQSIIRKTEKNESDCINVKSKNILNKVDPKKRKKKKISNHNTRNIGKNNLQNIKYHKRRLKHMNNKNKMKQKNIKKKKKWQYLNLNGRGKSRKNTKGSNKKYEEKKTRTNKKLNQKYLQHEKYKQDFQFNGRNLKKHFEIKKRMVNKQCSSPTT